MYGMCGNPHIMSLIALGLYNPNDFSHTGMDKWLWREGEKLVSMVTTALYQWI